MDGRIIHSLTVSAPEGKFWTEVYTHVKNHPSGIPFNILLTYFYIKSVGTSFDDIITSKYPGEN